MPEAETVGACLLRRCLVHLDEGCWHLVAGEQRRKDARFAKKNSGERALVPSASFDDLHGRPRCQCGVCVCRPYASIQVDAGN